MYSELSSLVPSFFAAGRLRRRGGRRGPAAGRPGVELGPANPDAAVLKLGFCGSDSASHLKARAHLTLTDIAPAMLALSATLNPECEHIAGDMRTLRLDRAFDAVLLHDEVTYMTTKLTSGPPWSHRTPPSGPVAWCILLPDFAAPVAPARDEARRARWLRRTVPPLPQVDR